MTDTTTGDTAATSEQPRRSGALSAMRLAQLQQLASSMGITGTAKMRKSDLVTAIRAKQSGASAPAATSPAKAATKAPAESAPADQPAQSAGADRSVRADKAADQNADKGAERPARAESDERSTGREQSRRERGDDREARSDERNQGGGNDRNQGGERNQGGRNNDQQGGNRNDRNQGGRNNDQQGGSRNDRNQGGGNDRSQGGERNQGGRNNDQQGGNRNDRNQGGGNDRNQGGNRSQGGGNDQYGDDERGGRRSRNRNRNRNRDKRRGGGQQYDDTEQQIHEDDVLVPVAGILDVLDNYAFVRTSGYLPGSTDVYVPLNMVKRNGLRKGDAVTGQVKAAREGEEPQQQTINTKGQRGKFNSLAKLETVNGMSAEDAKRRVEFGKLTPLYPQDRLRLETESNVLTTRMIDLVAPIGKGQRGLIVAPAKAGKTMVMQSLANAISTNNPECHLMVVLVDERPEEVTDMQRAVKGEVIASTFDRPAEDHTTVAELAIERAKRLVEMGHDVVVLLDSITKLGRAYNLAAPASGRILSGGVDSAALYPPKKFFGAARNIENGGSLTILATALVETGSRMDEVIFEEFKGTGNMELKLDRGLANRRIFPAVDVNASGTRREEILLAPEELRIMWKLRRVLAALDTQQGVELLLDRLRKTKTNYEFLSQVAATSSIKLGDEDESA
ncbi:transcription termination factor Rho [Janibacter limosus]|uniref:transcription termination factor Rho n=1 Tax=Janibacter limosus TaxID=53458 RepID=UPI00083334CC|nr:transcription termination factor Rho [Janibacter limosus]